MRHADQEIDSVGALLSQMKRDINDYRGPVWFRGHSNLSWNLEPRFMREGTRLSETHVINRFKQDATYILDRPPRDEFDWLFLMQHHGVPTRLLDWSENPLVALYFAVYEYSDDDGALWLLLPCALNQKNNYKPDFEFEVPSFEDEHMRNYLPSTIARERSSSLNPMAAIAPRNSSRMQAQQAVFTISHRENIHLDNVGYEGAPKDHIWRYIIRNMHKPVIAKELKLLGISHFQLFPELASLSHEYGSKK